MNPFEEQSDISLAWKMAAEIHKLEAENAELKAKLRELEQQEPSAWRLLAKNGNTRMWWTDKEKVVIAEKDEVAQELYAQPKPASVPEWLPIDSAPKNGTVVLLSNGKCVWAAKYVDVYTSGYRPESPWHSMMLNGDYIPAKDRGGIITNWMPLPAAPKLEEVK